MRTSHGRAPLPATRGLFYLFFLASGWLIRLARQGMVELEQSRAAAAQEEARGLAEEVAEARRELGAATARLHSQEELRERGEAAELRKQAAVQQVRATPSPRRERQDRVR